MTLSKLSGPAVLFICGVAAVLAPTRFPAMGTAAPSTAECATCCSESGPLCVICARTCVTVQDAYDSGTGPCP